jgi:hypothetical protein
MPENGRRDVQRQIDALTSRMGRNEDEIAELHAEADVDRNLVAELQADGLLDRAHVGHLETALKTSRRIGTAIGILMASQHFTEIEAFDALVRASQQANRKLNEIANDVVESGELP